MEIVLASHSMLAKGMFETVSLIMGKQDNLHYITAYVDDRVDFKDQLNEVFEPISKQKVVFVSDVIGGSVNTELLRFVNDREGCFLVSGMNLPFVLELLSYSIVAQKKDESDSEIEAKLVSLVDQGRQGIQLVHLQPAPEDEHEEDF